MDVVRDIKKLKCGKVKTDILLEDYTTYKLGGQALIVVYPNSIENLIKLMNYIKENKCKYKIIGHGSNLIFTTEYYDGILIKLTDLSHLEIEGMKITVGAGYGLTKLAYKCAKLGLTGFEFAVGIPGTIGGAVYMNAGAYKSDMGYIVSEVKVLTPNLDIKTIYNRDLTFHYRDSFFQHNPGYICLEATIILKPGKVDAIMNLINERKRRRLMSQPLEYPSAGSVFRNPENDYAGRIIEELGYKGKVLNGVEVSEKHANFIVNKTKATGDNVKKLITMIQKDVSEKYNIDLILEQEYVE